MLLPRMLALAEVAWSPKGNKDYANFSEARLPRHLARLDARGYNYRVPVAIGASDTILTGSRFSIDLSPSVEGATIYYTLDGYNPSETDIPYTAPIKIIIPENKTVELKTIVITPTGKRSIVADMKLQNK
jgi:hexosaminidase